MATKRRTSSSKRKSNKPKAEDIRKAEEFQLEIILWIIIATALLLFISNFGFGGVVGNAVSSFIFGLFGLVAYVFPIILVVATVFATSNRGNIGCSNFICYIFVCLFIFNFFRGFDYDTGRSL